MASSEKNLSHVKAGVLANPERIRIGVVVSEWNKEITESLCSGAYQTLLEAGIPMENIDRINVPGSFELSLGSQWMIRKRVDAVVCLGCVIQGETKHFDFICDAVANGITKVGLKYNTPVIFGVLTTCNMNQALDRAGGKHGNKGNEAAAAALAMLAVKPGYRHYA